jgi:hypothetical protein
VPGFLSFDTLGKTPLLISIPEFTVSPIPKHPQAVLSVTFPKTSTDCRAIIPKKPAMPVIVQVNPNMPQRICI